MKVIRIWILVWSITAIFACANTNENNGKSAQNAHSEVNEKQATTLPVSERIEDVKVGDKSNVILVDNEISKSEVTNTQVKEKHDKKVVIKSKSDRESIKVVNEEKVIKQTPSEASTQSTKSGTEIPPNSSSTPENTANAVSTDVRKTLEPKVTEPKAVVDNTKAKVTEKVNDEQSKVGSETSKQDKPAKPGRLAQSKPMHKYFDYILKNHVSADGTVDYKGIQSDVDRLDKYIADLENFSPKGDWTKNEKLAYWINAYNAYTIKLIVDNYPLNSITELHGGKPWDHKWIKLDGKTLSLNAIENEIIRPTFKEPRIHFAVNCAAKSCPPLMNTAYTADNLEALLTKSTIQFINNEKYNTLTVQPAQVSKIFEWYAEDFGDVVTFINSYMQLKQPPIKKVVYGEYDWSLNGK